MHKSQCEEAAAAAVAAGSRQQPQQGCPPCESEAQWEVKQILFYLFYFLEQGLIFTPGRHETCPFNARLLFPHKVPSSASPSVCVCECFHRFHPTTWRRDFLRASVVRGMLLPGWDVQGHVWMRRRKCTVWASKYTAMLLVHAQYTVERCLAPLRRC